MKLISGLRALATLRRIAKALDRANELEEMRMRYEFPDYAREQTRGKKIRKTVITAPTTEEWNEKYRDRRGM